MLTNSISFAVDLTAAILAGEDFDHDLKTRVEHHPVSLEDQDRNAAIMSEFFVSPDARISQDCEDAIFEAAAVLARTKSEHRQDDDPASKNVWLYHFAAALVQVPAVSALTLDEIELAVERASFAV